LLTSSREKIRFCRSTFERRFDFVNLLRVRSSFLSFSSSILFPLFFLHFILIKFYLFLSFCVLFWPSSNTLFACYLTPTYLINLFPFLRFILIKSRLLLSSCDLFWSSLVYPSLFAIYFDQVSFILFFLQFILIKSRLSLFSCVLFWSSPIHSLPLSIYYFDQVRTRSLLATRRRRVCQFLLFFAFYFDQVSSTPLFFLHFILIEFEHASCLLSSTNVFGRSLPLPAFYFNQVSFTSLFLRFILIKSRPLPSSCDLFWPSLVYPPLPAIYFDQVSFISLFLRFILTKSRPPSLLPTFYFDQIRQKCSILTKSRHCFCQK